MDIIDASNWTRRRRQPWYVRDSLVGVLLLVALIFGFASLLGILATWLADAPSFSNQVLQAMVAITATSMLGLCLVGYARVRWEAALPGECVRAEWRKMTSSERSPQVPPSAMTGVITSVQDPQNPTLVWNHGFERGDYFVSVTAQPFVISAGDDSWLVDTKYIEVGGGAWLHGRAGWQALTGDRVMLFPIESTLVDAPAWSDAAASAAGYRTRRISHVTASEVRPLQLILLGSAVNRPQDIHRGAPRLETALGSQPRTGEGDAEPEVSTHVARGRDST
jgi:hypothetical protein